MRGRQLAICAPLAAFSPSLGVDSPIGPGPTGRSTSDEASEARAAGVSVRVAGAGRDPIAVGSQSEHGVRGVRTSMEAALTQHRAAMQTV